MTEQSTNHAPMIAIVTGGSRGLGRSTVLALAERGVSSIFTYRAARDEAEATVAAVEAKGPRAVALPLDTGDTSSFPAFVARGREALARLGSDRFDILVNNAGTAHHRPIAETTEA